MEDLKIGQLVEGKQTRDAIHIAVAPVVANEILAPGQHVGFVKDTRKFGMTGHTLGIVDPYLRGYVPEGATFWLFLYPGSVTSIKHRWEHPDFNDVEMGFISKEILGIFANSMGEDYETIMKHLTQMDEHGHVQDEDAHGEIPPHIWEAYEKVTGKAVTDKYEYFSCSC